MPNIGPLELIVVLIIALLVLGPKKLPDAGRSVGRGIREFKDAIAGNANNRAADGINTHDPATTITNNTAPDNEPSTIAAGTGAHDGGGPRTTGNGNLVQWTGGTRS
jgi:sec-independent protein translocase protein TatA